MLDCSQRADLATYVPVVAELEAAARHAGLKLILSGAFARDLHLGAHGILVGRRTEDLDFAVAVTAWNDFDRLKRELAASGSFKLTESVHRVQHLGTGFLVDLVPFGGIEGELRRVAWPPDGGVVMDVFGFSEAHDSGVEVRLPQGVRTRVVSLPALIILKLVAWQDRHVTHPRKDAYDIMLIASNYLLCGGHDRLLSEPWIEDPDFDYETAGARLLGTDMQAVLDASGIERILVLLRNETSEKRPGMLAFEMDQADPNRARRLLRAMIKGLEGVG